MNYFDNSSKLTDQSSECSEEKNILADIEYLNCMKVIIDFIIA